MLVVDVMAYRVVRLMYEASIIVHKQALAVTI